MPPAIFIVTSSFRPTQALPWMWHPASQPAFGRLGMAYSEHAPNLPTDDPLANGCRQLLSWRNREIFPR